VGAVPELEAAAELEAATAFATARSLTFSESLFCRGCSFASSGMFMISSTLSMPGNNRFAAFRNSFLEAPCATRFSNSARASAEMV